jgi:hypothetical protein
MNEPSAGKQARDGGSHTVSEIKIQGLLSEADHEK